MIAYAEVIGDPIAQSKSPAIHGFWLRQLEIDADYCGTRVEAEGLGDFLAQRRSDPDWRGCNVTMPHKQAIVAHLDHLDPLAETIGVVDTVVQENRALVERIARPAGIPPSIVVALWGIESKYGERLGDFEVVPALATLAFNGFRASFFRAQLIAALKIVSQGHIGLHAMKGSWAGAMGQCQFIPTTFLLYAADGDGDGRYDIWTSKADVFASTVNYLHRVGWRPGLGWGEEVEGSAAAGKGERIVRPSGAGGPPYRTTENFRATLRWNQSDFFALAVGLLSDRIAAA